MGLILDLTVAAIAGVVVVSLALLAWTLAISAVASVNSSRNTVGEMRRTIAEAEASLAESSRRLRAATESLERRSRDMRVDLAAEPSEAAPRAQRTT